MAKHTGKIGVGIVGTGGIAQGAHLQGWQKLQGDRVELLAAYDVKPEVAKAAAERFGIPRVCKSLNEMLRMDDVHIVDVCTPNKFHAPQTVPALKAGKHVIVEKPMAMTVAEARRMCKAAKDARRKLMVAQSMRFTSESMALKQFVDEGGLGRPYYARASALRRRGIPGWGVFTSKELQGGGPLIDIGVHILDLTLWLMGFPEPVSVSGATMTHIGTRKGVGGMGAWDWRHYTVEDHACGLIRFKTGAVVYLEASFALNVPQDYFSTHICGTKGGVSSSPLTFVREEYGNLVNSTPQFLPSMASHHEEIRQFVECIRRDTPSPVPGEQALITQKILNGIYESAESGSEVTVR